MKHIIIEFWDGRRELFEEASNVIIDDEELSFITPNSKWFSFVLDQLARVEITPVRKEEEMEKTKMFISQPMRGKSKDEIMEERVRAIKLIEDTLEYKNVEVIESYYEDFTEDTPPLKYLARSIGDLAEADVAVFIGKWHGARGCLIEHTCAIEYGIKSVYMK